MKKIIPFAVCVFLGSFSFAQELVPGPLSILEEDIRLEYKEDSFEKNEGYDLFIRKKPMIESVLLVETTKDPEGKADNFAYRASEYNSVNGDEIRYLDGKILNSEHAKYSLTDSSIEPDPEFGEAFHIYIPSKLEYGYPWSRNGTVEVKQGLFINIRSFTKKYNDYTGQFFDNPFMFDMNRIKSAKPKPVLTDAYNPTAAANFAELAEATGGEMTISKGPDSLVDDIIASIERIDPKKNAEIVFALDTTGSMQDDIKKIREELMPKLKATAAKFKKLRLGLLLYRDYGSSYGENGLPVKHYEFTDKLDEFEKNLNAFSMKKNEGGDIPEAVYEALYASMDFYSWKRGTQRKVILIGDAEPHPSPRGSKKYTLDLVMEKSDDKNMTIDTIILPDNKSDRGRASAK